MAEDGTLISAPEQTLPPVEESAPTETTKPVEDYNDDNSDITDTPTEEVSADTKTMQVWPFVVGGVVLAVIISVIIAISKRKKAIPHDKGIEEAEADDNGGSEE